MKNKKNERQICPLGASKFWQRLSIFFNAHGSHSLTLQEFAQKCLGVLQAFRPENKNVDAKIRQQFQFLKDEGLLTFVNNNGFYTLRDLALLEQEMEAINAIDLWDSRDALSLPAGFGE